MTDTAENTNPPIGKSQEKVCEYMFPLSSKDLTRKTTRSKSNVGTSTFNDNNNNGGTRSRSRTRINGYNGGENDSKNDLIASTRNSNKSYTDTGGIYIYVFRNSDPFFLGKKMLVTEKLYRNWEQFVISVIKNVDLVKSTCRIFNLNSGKEINDCSELIDGEKYIAACKHEKLNLNINYRTTQENKEYQLQKDAEEQKKIMLINERYRKKKNNWIFQREQKRLNDLENKREVIVHKERGVEEYSKKRELLRKFKLERIDQEQKRIRYKQKNREIGNRVINRSLTTVEPEKIFDRETKGYRIYLHKNGDYFTTGTRFVLNFNNSSSLLAMILSIRENHKEFWNARRIFDINTFKRIQKIEEIEDDKHYIITGKELLRKDQPYRTVPDEVIKIDPMIIHVYPNGDGLSIPTNIRVTSQKFPTFEKLMRFIDGNMHLITGCIKILYNMQGKKITSIDQLENEQEYVAASYNEPFYNIKYNINSFKRHRRYTCNRNASNDENKNTDEKNNRSEGRSESRNRSRSESRNKSSSRTRSMSVGKDRSMSMKSHSRSVSEIKDINKDDPVSLRKVKTEQGTSLRSSMKNMNDNRPITSKPNSEVELKSCLSKTKSKEKTNVVIDSNPNILNEVELERKTSPKAHSRRQSQKEEELKQFTSETTNTNHDLTIPRKSD